MKTTSQLQPVPQCQPKAGPCPKCDSPDTLCSSYPGDHCDCVTCGHSWPWPDSERLAVFVDHYIQAALWSSVDNRDDSGGTPLDDAKYGESKLTRAARKAMRADCLDFLRRHAGLICALESVANEYGYGSHPDCGRTHPIMAAAAHDLWLTRNGHGAGFWDRGLPEDLADALSDAARAAGTRDLYVERGWIYQS